MQELDLTCLTDYERELVEKALATNTEEHIKRAFNLLELRETADVDLAIKRARVVLRLEELLYGSVS